MHSQDGSLVSNGIEQIGQIVHSFIILMLSRGRRLRRFDLACDLLPLFFSSRLFHLIDSLSHPLKLFSNLWVLLHSSCGLLHFSWHLGILLNLGKAFWSQVAQHDSCLIRFACYARQLPAVDETSYRRFTVNACLP